MQGEGAWLHARTCARSSTCTLAVVRTTVEFEDDVAKAIAELRRTAGMGVSEAVNELIRRGMLPRRRSRAFRQTTRSLGLTIDVTNVAEALDLLEGSDAR